MSSRIITKDFRLIPSYPGRDAQNMNANRSDKSDI